MVADDSTVVRGRTAEVRVPRAEWGETKSAFKTTEFLAYLATVVGVIIVTAALDGVNAWDGCLFVTALTVGYLLSRGLAKAGSRAWDTD